ncbi:MAG: hypothetical protein EXR51_00090 [Dehalococcoidia bacterium]|nr:hypothetical protein [Dehalococcoidia bacterium]
MNRPATIAFIAAGLVVAAAAIARPSSNTGPPPAVQSIATATPLPAPTPTLAPGVRILTEEQLNQQIGQAMQPRAGAVPFRDVRVALLGDGKVALTGVTAVAGSEVQVQVSLGVQMARGVLNIDILGAQAGVLPVPAGLAEALATQAAQAAGLPGLKGIALPPEVEAVTVRQGAVIIRMAAR